MESSIEELEKLDEKRTGSLLHDLVLYAFRFQNYNKMQEPSLISIRRYLTPSADWPGRDRASLSEDALISPWTENAMYLNCLSILPSVEKRKRHICEVDDIAFEKAEEEIQKRTAREGLIITYFTGKLGIWKIMMPGLNNSVLGYEGCADLIG